jgi:hypothetical protein
MSENKPNLLDRREFLQGAATVVGAVAIGVGTNSEAAPSSVKTKSTPKLSVGFWDGDSLHNASALPSGDASLAGTSVKMIISGKQHAGSLVNAIDVHYPVLSEGTQTAVPHHAWTRVAHRTMTNIAVVPVVDNGVRLSVQHQGMETPLHLSLNDDSSALKLRIGTYVIASHDIAWGMYQMEASNDPGEARLVHRTLSGFVPANIEHITVTVERA